MGKIKLCGLIFIGGFMGLMTSCLGDNSYDAEDWTLGNAQIASFSITCDSVKVLDATVFTIDQINGLIYNKDSMPFGTSLDYKVIASIGFDSPYGVRDILIIEGATGDSIQTTTDSINFSAPLTIAVTAYDGLSKKTYEAKVNVHQVNPDTMIWEKYAEILPGKTFQDMKVIKYDGFYAMYVLENSVYQLYRSDIPDITRWEKLELSGFPDKANLSQITELDSGLYVITEAGDLYFSDDGQTWSQVEMDFSITALLGFLPSSDITGRKDVICCVAEVDGGNRFMTFDKDRLCTIGQAMPENFPITGFSHFDYKTMYYPRLVVASGRDSKNNLIDKAWATMDGCGWALLANPQSKSFTAREGTSAFLYGGTFFIIGGLGVSETPLRDVCFSIDQGITWFSNYFEEVTDEDGAVEVFERFHYPMPDEFEGRGFMSVLVDDDNYILLFGGKAMNNTNVLSEIWRGRVNHMGFGKNR